MRRAATSVSSITTCEVRITVVIRRLRRSRLPTKSCCRWTSLVSCMRAWDTSWLSSDPSVSICLTVDNDRQAWRAALAAALTACPHVPHEVIVLTTAGKPPFGFEQPLDGFRIVRYGAAAEHATLWRALGS